MLCDNDFMSVMSLAEAQLFRLLGNLFGGERVVPHMTVRAVCGGELPTDHGLDIDLPIWAAKNTCLFTVVDYEDRPKMVVEFFSGFGHAIDPIDLEHQRFLKPLLARMGILYITISQGEFDEVLDPSSDFDIVSLFRDKCGIE